MITANLMLPSAKYKRKMTVFGVIAVVVAVCCVLTKFNPIGIFTEFHFVQDLLGEMFPPNLSVLTEASMGWALLETISMAFLGTVYGGLIALIMAFLAANNTMPYKVVRLISGGILTFMRVVPILVVVLIFVIAVGPSAFAGMLSLVFVIAGNFGRLFTEMIENVENPPGEAIYSVGASRLQVIRYSVIPQIMPQLIANLLYAFDTNIRAAVAIGVFGGGGIGFKLILAKSVLHYRDVIAYVCLMMVLVILVEKISDYLRKKILGEGKLR